MKQRNRKPRLRLYPVALLAALWLAPALLWVGGFLLNTWATDHAIEPLTTGTVTAGSRDIDALSGVDVRVTLGHQQHLTLNGTGMVTKVFMLAGDTPTTGKPILVLDGIPRIGYTAEVPFYRDLEMGDTGEDIVTLARLLHDTGYLAETPSEQYFDWNLAHALMLFQAANGLHDDGVLRSEEFVFLPAALGTLTDVTAVVGEQLPADGHIATGSGTQHAVTIVTAGSETPPSGFHSDDTIMLTAGEAQLSITGFRIESDAATAMLATLDDWARQGLIDRTHDDDGGLSYTGAFVALEHPINVAVVPNSAVLAGADGNTCVIRVTTQATQEAVRVTPRPIVGELGVTGIDAELIGTEIVRNTIDHDKLPACR